MAASIVLVVEEGKYRFIYRYRSAVEIGNVEFLQQVIQRGFATSSGE